MPLRALLDQHDIISTLLTDEEWAALKRRRTELTLPCCGERCYARTSPLGLRHFSHWPDSACKWSAPESDDHRALKLAVFEACRAAGYRATIEAVGPSRDWRADVLVDRGPSKDQVAFELQLSPQDIHVTQERQARYGKDCVRACWLFARWPTDHPAPPPGPPLLRDYMPPVPSLPLFLAEQDEAQEWGVAMYGRRIAIPTFVQAILFGQLSRVTRAMVPPERAARLALDAHSCDRCGAIDGTCSITVFEPVHLPCGAALAPDVRAVTKAFQVLLPGPMRARDAHAAMERMRELLPASCHVLRSEVADELVQQADAVPINAMPVLDRIITERRQGIGHWCLSLTGVFCDGSPPVRPADFPLALPSAPAAAAPLKESARAHRWGGAPTYPRRYRRARAPQRVSPTPVTPVKLSVPPQCHAVARLPYVQERDQTLVDIILIEVAPCPSCGSLYHGYITLRVDDGVPLGIEHDVRGALITALFPPHPASEPLPKRMQPARQLGPDEPQACPHCDHAVYTAAELLVMCATDSASLAALPSLGSPRT